MVDLVKVSALATALDANLDRADIVYIVQDVSGVKTSYQTTLGAIIDAAVAEVGTIPDLTLVDFVNDSSTARNFAAADAGKLIRHTSGSATIATIQLNATAAIPTKTVVSGRQISSGAVTIEGVLGVTLNVPAGYQAITRDQGSDYMLHKVDTDEYDLTGDLLPE